LDDDRILGNFILKLTASSAFSHLKLSPHPYSLSMRDEGGIVSVAVHCASDRAAKEIRANRVILARYLRSQKIKASYVAIVSGGVEVYAFAPSITLAMQSLKG
jgi:hypothetical protein